MQGLQKKLFQHSCCKGNHYKVHFSVECTPPEHLTFNSTAKHYGEDTWSYHSWRKLKVYFKPKQIPRTRTLTITSNEKAYLLY